MSGKHKHYFPRPPKNTLGFIVGSEGRKQLELVQHSQGSCEGCSKSTGCKLKAYKKSICIHARYEL